MNIIMNATKTMDWRFILIFIATIFSACISFAGYNSRNSSSEQQTNSTRLENMSGVYR